VSNKEGNDEWSDRTALTELEGAVSGLLDRLAGVSARAEDAEGKSEELEELVKRFTGDGAEAGRMLSRLKGLEEENQDLRSRLETGRDGVDKVLAKIKFLEEQR
jgi:hypothetical protein